MLQFIKNWTLPLAMLAGVIGYFCFATFDFLTPTRPVVKILIAWLTPFLIFAQLLLTFCKVEVKELVPQCWQGWLLLVQFLSCLLVACLLLFLPLDEYWRAALQGAMVCLCYYWKAGRKCCCAYYLYIVVKFACGYHGSIGLSFGRTN